MQFLDKQLLIKNDNKYLIIAVIIMIALFISSEQTAAQQSTQGLLQSLLSNKPLEKFLELISFSYNNKETSIKVLGYFGFIEFFLRKAAHFGIFFLLAVFLFLGLRHRLDSYIATFFISIMTATGYAAFDEAHQEYTFSRVASFADVKLDASAAFCACLILLFYHLFIRNPYSIKNN